MALQLLPMLVRVAKGVGAAPFNAARNFGQAASVIARRPTGQPMQFNLQQLARQLGTPNPSPAQIAAHQQKIAQHNRQFNFGPRASQAADHFGEGVVELGKFATAIAAASKGLTALAHVANDAAIGQLRMFNPQIAALASEKERFQMRYQIQRGQAVSGSHRELASALMSAQREWQPFSQAGEIIGNKLMTWGAEMLAGLGGLLETLGITDAVRAFVESQRDKRKQAQAPMQRFINDTLAGRRLSPLNGRPNERPGDRI